MKKTIIQSFKWIFIVSKRFSRVDRKGRSAATSVLATLGIAFGVMTLIVVMSVMNGFQMSFIDSILELSSYHIRVENLPSEMEDSLIQKLKEDNHVISYTPFYEAQALVTGKKGGASSVLIRAINQDVYDEDPGFKKEMKFISGSFDFSEKNSIVLGSSLARNLGLHLGDSVNLMVMSGGSDVNLFSNDRIFTVSGVFTSGYQAINNSYAFVDLSSANEYFGSSSKKYWGIKLKNYNSYGHSLALLREAFPAAKIEAWSSYNKTFFGTLRIEKDMLRLLVGLIFVVVAINIYNGMRRLVFERRNEIAILSALGGRKWEIKAIFITRGFLTGLIGSLLGLLLGLLISINTDHVFNAAAKLMYFFQYIFTAITNPQNLMYVSENSSYSIYASIPARIFPGEVIAITLFGMLAPLFASWAASKNVLKMTVSEVLHNE
ncbi:MAG: ABC transporter permease [Treponema sp.]|nr:ABC transporter permease [Treponema sp.]